MPVLDVSALIEDRVGAIAEMHRRLGVARAQLDVSGGVDSAVLLGLLARAVGPGQITAVHSAIHSSTTALQRAQAAAAAFDVPLVVIDATALFETLVQKMRAALDAAGFDARALALRLEADPSILGSLRSCLRAPLGRGFNRMTGGGIRHGTGNECEDRFLRFYQKGGDGEVDTNPIAMLAKGEVLQLARALGVPRAIVTALPTPDLHGVGDAHNDEDELRALYGVAWTYSRIDPDSGAYTDVGSIERVARLLDRELPSGQRFESALFADEGEPAWQAWSTWAAPALPGLTVTEVEALLRAARRAEALTRHKANPNIPTLGSRAALLAAGIVTDRL